MVVKLSNEIKVGLLAVIVLSLFFIGFHFLKGNKIFGKDFTLIAKYSNIQGLTPSNPVLINGMQVGSVKEINSGKDMRELSVTIGLDKEINIPVNSVALIIPNPLSGTRIEIKLGNSTEYLKTGGNIITEANEGLLNDVMKKVDPVLFEVKNTLTNIDTLLANVNSTIDPSFKQNLGKTLENFKNLSESLVSTSASIQKLAGSETQTIRSSLQNINSFTENLANNNRKINDLLNNLTATSDKISKLDLQKLIHTIDSSVNSFQSLLNKINSQDGTAGLLLNDPTLYRNIAATSNKLNLLLDDIRVNPKRYINISVFGRKQKINPLLVPLPDTVHAPYVRPQP
ncbi:MAG: MCE family protein [Ferruginibacter sp.]|nr:MCE family protein [Ferruginibacter sp.]